MLTVADLQTEFCRTSDWFPEKVCGALDLITARLTAGVEAATILADDVAAADIS